MWNCFFQVKPHPKQWLSVEERQACRHGNGQALAGRKKGFYETGVKTCTQESPKRTAQPYYLQISGVVKLVEEKESLATVADVIASCRRTMNSVNSCVLLTPSIQTIEPQPSRSNIKAAEWQTRLLEAAKCCRALALKQVSMIAKARKANATLEAPYYYYSNYTNENKY